MKLNLDFTNTTIPWLGSLKPGPLSIMHRLKSARRIHRPSEAHHVVRAARYGVAFAVPSQKQGPWISQKQNPADSLKM